MILQMPSTTIFLTLVAALLAQFALNTNLFFLLSGTKVHIFFITPITQQEIHDKVKPE